MRKNDFIRIGIGFIITAALIEFINLVPDGEVNNQLDEIFSASPIIFGFLGLIMIFYGFFFKKMKTG